VPFAGGEGAAAVVAAAALAEVVALPEQVAVVGVVRELTCQREAAPGPVSATYTSMIRVY